MNARPCQRRGPWVAALTLWLGCIGAAPAEPRPQPGQPSVVRVVASTAGGWTLEVNGEPFFVRGAGVDGGDLSELAARGGNAVRTWSGDRLRGRRGSVLDAALEQGLFVALGLEVGRERHGFDYGDARAVERQLERLRREARRHRDHPALLLWVVGNELNLGARDPRVWDAVNGIVQMIRAEDPAHPVLTPLAGIDAGAIADLTRRAPALELLGVQLYGAIERLPDLAAAGWRGPYLVTEWGPTGHWEVAQTPWGAPIEDSSHAKAQRLLQRYRGSILADPAHCLGSFAFLWGQKQERTPTWYGLFLASGEATEAVDALQQLWTGHAPERPAPAVHGLRLDRREAADGIVLAPGQAVLAEVEAVSAAPSELRFDWEIRQESRATSIGGDAEALPRRVSIHLTTLPGGRAGFEAPRRSGNYRLFVTVRDAGGKAGHANLPFRVAPR